MLLNLKMINIAWNQFKTIFDARSTRTFFVTTEAVTRMCSVKEMLLKISKNSQESTCARVSFLVKLQAGARHRTPPVAASVTKKNLNPADKYLFTVNNKCSKLMCRVLRWICSKFTIKTAERLRLMLPYVPFQSH